jgi:hypothetical protein
MFKRSPRVHNRLAAESVQDRKTLRLAGKIAPVLDGEALELLKHGYHKFRVAEVFCSTCDTFFRLALGREPDEQEPCPECSQQCATTDMHGMIYSRREQPFYEVAEGPRMPRWRRVRAAQPAGGRAASGAFFGR